MDLGNLADDVMGYFRDFAVLILVHSTLFVLRNGPSVTCAFHVAVSKIVGERQPGDTRFATTPVVLGDRLFVIDDGGRIAAFRAGGGSGR